MSGRQSDVDVNEGDQIRSHFIISLNLYHCVSSPDLKKFKLIAELMRCKISEIDAEC